VKPPHASDQGPGPGQKMTPMVYSASDQPPPSWPEFFQVRLGLPAPDPFPGPWPGIARMEQWSKPFLPGDRIRNRGELEPTANPATLVPASSRPFKPPPGFNPSAPCPCPISKPSRAPPALGRPIFHRKFNRHRLLLVPGPVAQQNRVSWRIRPGAYATCPPHSPGHIPSRAWHPGFQAPRSRACQALSWPLHL